MRKKMTAAMITVMVMVGAMFATSASADVVMGGQPTVVSSSSTSTVSAVAAAKIAGYSHVGIYVNVKKSKVNRKRCFWAKGKWTNSTLIGGTSFKSYKETSRAKFCKLKKPIRRGGRVWYYVKVAGGLTGSPCYNLAVPPGHKQPKPQLRGKVLDLRTLKFNVTITLNASAKVAASATCVTRVNGNVVASASAYAEATGTASANVNVTVSAKTKMAARFAGSVSYEQKTKIEIDAQASASLNLSAAVRVSCNGDVYICPVGSTWNGERCAKDGTTTPPPPPEAPGPNPPPDPNEPFPGGYQCYKETTGEPVPPVNGLCPAGTVGNPI